MIGNLERGGVTRERKIKNENVTHVIEKEKSRRIFPTIYDTIEAGGW